MKRLYVITLLLLVKGFVEAQTSIKFNSPLIHYMGRVAITDSAAMLSWSGTSVKINFTGTCIKFTLSDQRGENFINEIIDGKVVGVLTQTSDKKITSSICNLSPGRHTLELFKRSEWTKGKMYLYGFEVNKDDHFLDAPITKKRKIEFYGNSITVGYAIEDSTGQDRAISLYQNNYLTYAAITARHFDAEYSCIARSGIGVLVSWFPQTMPEMYNLLDPSNPKSFWDFSKYTPDVVVVDLLQNDSWLVNIPDHPQFKARFGNKAPNADQIITAYRNFIKTLRGKYPNAQIICTLGSMDATKPGSPWPGYVSKAVAGLADKKIYNYNFPYKGGKGHPSKHDHRLMASQLISFIHKNIKW